MKASSVFGYIEFVSVLSREGWNRTHLCLGLPRPHTLEPVEEALEAHHDVMMSKN
jgi:hypothetical protein